LKSISPERADSKALLLRLRTLHTSASNVSRHPGATIVRHELDLVVDALSHAVSAIEKIAAEREEASPEP
jgi:hypothetical protein